ncbi:hypothetical protein BS47DRAFT_454601 [Hydnum rufescens UP504]|uniref:Uncharacterized protein n=1 Tax=Hydnum rufescens UP504 TaxID=1448309 RepID=A0A9P6AJZ5_9AGAM|nr:hypothetical protein BS47DRAFT_454601 [Hydnum rufescens UP504]
MGSLMQYEKGISIYTQPSCVLRQRRKPSRQRRRPAGSGGGPAGSGRTGRPRGRRPTARGGTATGSRKNDVVQPKQTWFAKLKVGMRQKHRLLNCKNNSACSHLIVHIREVTPFKSIYPLPGPVSPGWMFPPSDHSA